LRRAYARGDLALSSAATILRDVSIWHAFAAFFCDGDYEAWFARLPAKLAVGRIVALTTFLAVWAHIEAASEIPGRPGVKA
jgi:hypothetical protein